MYFEGLKDETRRDKSEEEEIFWHIKILPILHELEKGASCCSGKGVFSTLFPAGNMGLISVYYKRITVIGLCCLLCFHMFGDFAV